MGPIYSTLICQSQTKVNEEKKKEKKGKRKNKKKKKRIWPHKFRYDNYELSSLIVLFALTYVGRPRDQETAERYIS